MRSPEKSYKEKNYHDFFTKWKIIWQCKLSISNVSVESIQSFSMCFLIAWHSCARAIGIIKYSCYSLQRDQLAEVLRSLIQPYSQWVQNRCNNCYWLPFLCLFQSLLMIWEIRFMLPHANNVWLASHIWNTVSFQFPCQQGRKNKAELWRSGLVGLSCFAPC